MVTSSGSGSNVSKEGLTSFLETFPYADSGKFICPLDPSFPTYLRRNALTPPFVPLSLPTGALWLLHPVITKPDRSLRRGQELRPTRAGFPQVGHSNDGGLSTPSQYPHTWSKMRQLDAPQPQLLPDRLLRSEET